LQAVAQLGYLRVALEQLVLRHIQLRRCRLEIRRQILQLLLQAGDLFVALLRQPVLRALQLLGQTGYIRARVLQVGLQLRDFALALLQLDAERLQLNRLRLRQGLGIAQFSFD